MLRPFADSLMTTLLSHCCVEISQFYGDLCQRSRILSWIVFCVILRTIVFNILIKLEKVQIPILLFYYVFADYSNYINEKKKEINKKLERVRKLNEEVVEYIEASCQGREKDILGVPGVVGQAPVTPFFCGGISVTSWGIY